MMAAQTMRRLVFACSMALPSFPAPYSTTRVRRGQWLWQPCDRRTRPLGSCGAAVFIVLDDAPNRLIVGGFDVANFVAAF
jgi:hypothetical protein